MRYTDEDVQDAYFAYRCVMMAKAEGTTPEVEAVYGIEVIDPETNQRDENATRVLWNENISRLHHGQDILKEAKLEIGERRTFQQSRLQETNAPVIFFDAGYIATSPAWREVTLRVRG